MTASCFFFFFFFVLRDGTKVTMHGRDALKAEVERLREVARANSGV